MNKKEILELKRRFTKSGTTFSRFAGCYVDGERNKICTFNSPFLTLEDDDFYKYLEIASKTLSGSLGNNLLNLEFPISEEAPGGHQTFLMGIRESELANEDLLNSWYDLIIEGYQHTGNYLILLFLDAYDVPMKTSDNLKTGESEEVYTYLLGAICPVELSKPGLGYLETEQRIGSRIRDWVVLPPETGFLFPSFNKRSTDIHETLFYTKDTKNPHQEFMEKVLGCGVQHTAEEKKNTFTQVVMKALGPEDEESNDRYLKLERNLSDLKEQHDAAYEDEKEIPAFTLEKHILEEAFEDTAIPYEKQQKITQSLEKTFEEEKPEVEDILDKRAIRNNIDRLDKNDLQKELIQTAHQLKEAKEEVEALKGSGSGFDIVLHVSDDYAEEICTKVVDGERYILIPYSGNETVSINGEEADLF